MSLKKKMKSPSKLLSISIVNTRSLQIVGTLSIKKYHVKKIIYLIALIYESEFIYTFDVLFKSDEQEIRVFKSSTSVGQYQKLLAYYYGPFQWCYQ